ncbi:hypothetical protein MD537_20810, partial [Flavihumibacter sediminis]|nr:hypothetical protein [Flavihumibacter sediminis]
MNLEHLLEQYAKDPRLFQLADRLTMSVPQHLVLKNLTGSSPEFLLTALFKHSVSEQLNHVVVLNDAEEAAYFHNTLESLSKALDLFYFPSSFRIKKNYRLLNSSHVMLRTEA